MALEGLVDLGKPGLSEWKNGPTGMLSNVWFVEKSTEIAALSITVTNSHGAMCQGTLLRFF
jgi:hypothetical protein